MLAQIAHVVVNIQLRGAVVDISLYLSNKLLIHFLKLDKVLDLFRIVLRSYFLLDGFLMLDVLLPNVVEKVSEKSMVIDNQLVNYCPVNIL